MTERQVERVLRDTYFVSPERRRLCIETAEASRRAKAELKPEDISLYVGIPFCPTRCAYCSFVSQSVERTLGLVEPYLEVLHREITDAARMVQETGCTSNPFYMGGGTPTTLSTEQMDRLLTHLNRSFDLSGCAEYCIEAGRPDTIDREKLQVLLDHGVDRISVNPQSLEDHVSSPPSAAAIRPVTWREAMALATGMGFPHVNMDLIAGLPEDTPEGFRRWTPVLWGRQHHRPYPEPEKGKPHFAGELHHPLGGGGGRDAGLRQRRPPAGGLPPLLPVPAKSICPAALKTPDGAYPEPRGCIISTSWRSCTASSHWGPVAPPRWWIRCISASSGYFTPSTPRNTSREAKAGGKSPAFRQFHENMRG